MNEMNKYFENNSKDSELRIVFEKKKDEYVDLSSSIDCVKLEIEAINNQLNDYIQCINDSKKVDKIMYAITGIIVGITSITGLLTNEALSSAIIGIGTFSLSIPLTCLIQSATYRFHVKRTINDLNNELFSYKTSLKQMEEKLINIKNYTIDKEHNYIDSKVDSYDKHIELTINRTLKKYEKPYIRIKKKDIK